MPTSDEHDSLPCDAAEEAPGAAEEAPGGVAKGDQPGLPDPATVVSEETFISPKGRQYRILKTRQTDPYDPPAEEEPGP